MVGGWQVTGLGSLASTYFALPSGLFPTGTPVKIYGYQYPIQNCTSGACYPGYLWWNGYIPAYLINSHDASGKPNGYEGIPPNYQPAVRPLWSWPATIPSSSDPLRNFYGGNTVWVPISNGTVQRTTWAGLPPLRNQYYPSVRQWGSPQGVKGVLAGIRQAMDAQLPAAAAQATQAALAQIRTAMDKQAVTLTDGVTTALKTSLTAAILRVYFWGIFVVVAGLLVTFFLPEIALRKTVGHPAPAEGVPPSGVETEGSMAGNVAPATPASPER